jgi:PKD repeat protein
MRRLTIALLAVALLSLAVAAWPAGHVFADGAGSGRSAVLAQTSAAPVAQFSFGVPGVSTANQNPQVHDLIRFDASTSQGAGLTYAWNFGDNSPSATGTPVNHSFTTVDDFNVTLTVTDNAGRTATSTQSVRIVPLIQALVGTPPLQQVVPAGAIPVQLEIQAPGPTTLSASLTGDLITSKAVKFSTKDEIEAVTLNGVVADESNATIASQIIQTPGGSVPLNGNVNFDVTYQTSAGQSVDLSYVASLLKDPDPSKGTWAITYPNLSIVTGTGDPSQPDVNGYYLNGDPGFHHPNDPLVRKYAIQAARAGGMFPSDPAQIMENIYAYVGGLFNSDDPAQIEPDTVVAQKIASGELVPGQRDEKYICISQTYFLSSLARTLGLPSRELTIALAKYKSQDANTGDLTVTYVQEGATQVWFANAWHLYDTWLRIRNLADYLKQYYAYRAWYSFSPQSFELQAKDGSGLGLYGHDFAVYEEDGGAAGGDTWKLAEQNQRSGITIDNFPSQ